jgi:26S proteasome non-ATPase regulatory subunit 10
MEIATDTAKQMRDEELFKAAEWGDSSLFMSLSEEQLSKSLNFRNEDGRSLLHVAASFGHSQIVKLLSSSDEAKTVINSKDDEGWAPLHSAASIGNAELVEVLLTRGADVNAKNNGGRTALHYAASKGRLEIAQLLLTHGAKINITDKVL